MVAKAIRGDRSPAVLRGDARGERDGRVRARILAIAACQEGMPRCTAARLYGMSRNVLRIWVDRYNAEGLTGLRDRPRAGRRPRITPAQGARLRERVLAGPDLARDGVVAFRLVDIHRIAGEEFDIAASFTTIWREMKRQGLSWLNPRPQNPRADEAAQEDFKKTSARA